MSNTTDELESILLNRVVLVGDGDTTYKGYPAELMKELAALIHRTQLESQAEALKDAYNNIGDEIDAGIPESAAWRTVLLQLESNYLAALEKQA